MMLTAPDAEQLAQITRQLGRRPLRLAGTALCCPAGHPAVVVTYPLQRRRGRLLPFPTTHWLTCPNLVRSISQLERYGAIARAQAWLAANPQRIEAMHHAHRRAAELRWQLLDEADRKLIARHGLSAAFHERGIGGIRNFNHVKCLHAHYAFHLLHPTPLGSWLAQQAELHPCSALEARRGDGVSARAGM